jgi:cytochrome bd-type quinol oxidase subunit 2
VGFRGPGCDCETVVVETTHRAPGLSWRVVAVVAAALVYAWIASGLRPFTHPEAVAVAIPLVVGGIAMLRMHAEDGDATQRGTWVWAALFVALVALELVSYRLSPRIDHPTLSSIADSAMSTHPGRFVVFVAWLGVGYRLFRR